MNRHLSLKRAAPALILAAFASTVAAAEPARAGPVFRIAAGSAQLQDHRSLARVRRHIAVAARSLCDTGGIEAIYGNGKRRCIERVKADAERQLEARLETQLAARLSP